MIAAPPSRLFLLRHAHSSRSLPGQRDHLRPLDRRGRADAGALGLRIAAAGLCFGTAVCSTATRALQTFDAIRPHLAPPPMFEASDDLYALGIEAYFAAANRFAEKGPVLLVGHNPMIEEFALSLCTAHEDKAKLRDGFPTAGLAAILMRGPMSVAGGGRLESLIAPGRD